jgi:hypothetical protein
MKDEIDDSSPITNPKKLIIIIRHGERKDRAGETPKYHRMNSELTEKGKLQSFNVSKTFLEEIKKYGITDISPYNIQIRTSPYLRTIQTAVYFIKGLNEIFSNNKNNNNKILNEDENDTNITNIKSEDNSNLNDKIKNYEKQINSLKNENKKLYFQLTQYKNKYDNNNNNNFDINEENNNFNENNEINYLNELLNKYEKILKDCLKFINFINKKLNHKKISLIELKKNSNNLNNKILNSIKSDLNKYLNNNNLYLNNNNLNIKSLSDDESNLNNNFNNDNYYYDYYSPNKLKKCFACLLGYNVSNKGYSPIKCFKEKNY